MVATICALSLLYIYVADPPRITTHPRELKDAVPGKYVMFSVEATGTEPLGYKWEWNPAGERDGTEEWQPCDLKSFPGADSSILSVQKSNKGSYRCVVSNCAGNKISNSAELEVRVITAQIQYQLLVAITIALIPLEQVRLLNKFATIKTALVHALYSCTLCAHLQHMVYM